MNEPLVCKYHMVSVALLVKGGVRMLIEMRAYLLSGFTFTPHPLRASYHRLTRGPQTVIAPQYRGLCTQRCVMSRIKDVVVHLCLPALLGVGQPPWNNTISVQLFVDNLLSMRAVPNIRHMIFHHCSLMYTTIRLCSHYGIFSLFVYLQTYTHY